MSNYKYLKINSSDIGMRLDKLLLKKFTNASYFSIQKNIRKGLFKVNGKKKNVVTT